jgi:hypothetical protein
MYASRLNEPETFLISVFWGSNTAADFERFVSQWERLDQLGATRSDGVGLHIVAFHNIKERPDANQRKRFADIRKRTRTAMPVGALVSESVMVRGLLRVIQWIAPPPAHFRLGVFEHFEEAASWSEAHLRRDLPTLRDSYQEALTEARRER